MNTPSGPKQREQRTEPRFPVTTRALVDVLGDEPYSTEAELVNVSSRGMRLNTAHPIPADAALRIRLDLDQYLGEVTYCCPDGDRYSVGVALFNVMRNVAQVTERLNKILLPR